MVATEGVSEAGIEWRLMPELPSPEELMADHPPKLPPNDISVPAHCRDKYLRTQYLLKRFEAVEPLRRSVSSYRKEIQVVSDYSLYGKVFASGYHFSEAGDSCALTYPATYCPNRKDEESEDDTEREYLRPGSLVVLSPADDNFRSECYVAVVDDDPPQLPDDQRDLSSVATINIIWADPATAVTEPSLELIMLEATSGYYETNRHIMVGLQRALQYPSVLEKYTISGSTQVRSVNSEHERVIPSSATTFDASQRAAFDVATTKDLAIVQGPPGTGKTYTSIVALESLVQTYADKAQKDGTRQTPIIVAAQTNHALDQLLEHCLDDQVGSIVRLGGRSASDRVKARSLFNVRLLSRFSRPADKSERRARLTSLKAIEENIQVKITNNADDLREAGLLTISQFNSLVDEAEWETSKDAQHDVGPVARWLGVNNNNVISIPGSTSDSDFEEPPEREKTHARFVFVSLDRAVHDSVSVTGDRRDHQAKRLLARNPDLYDIKPTQRGLVYCYFRNELRQRHRAAFVSHLTNYREICKRLKISRNSRDGMMLATENVQIIGCTTTGLSKNYNLLESLKPQVLLVEEAAETQEANITAGLFPSLKQLILMGDHQQLVPHVDSNSLAGNPSNLNVSLFERLVTRLCTPYVMLKVQRRMAPQIREVVQTFYASLKDHDTVNQRLPVPGMGQQRLWWRQHTCPESRLEHSFFNPGEAWLVIDFVRHLVTNGNKPCQITILTYYRAQVEYLMKQLRSDDALISANPCGEWLVRTIDGYQGEENDVVILSLVRNAESGGKPSAGFVENENRAVVATSRARRGFYIFGGAMNILQSSEQSRGTWQKVFDVFQINKCTGFSLPLLCEESIPIQSKPDRKAVKAVKVGKLTTNGPISPKVLKGTPSISSLTISSDTSEDTVSNSCPSATLYFKRPETFGSRLTSEMLLSHGFHESIAMLQPSVVKKLVYSKARPLIDYEEDPPETLIFDASNASSFNVAVNSLATITATSWPSDQSLI